ncbi:MAG: hypoxanthine phosphoribosyltransferase [Porticoccaceae bacterium]|nr:hypoxanthine phosphoribosyltransferase [Porticoccaceae bacterium]
MDSKIFISANELLEDAFELGKQVLDSGFQPDLIVGIWRGGSPIAIAIHELLSLAGVVADHIPVRSQLYSGVDQQRGSAELCGLEYIAEHRGGFKKILLVDDVLDSGQTFAALISNINSLYIDHPNSNTDTGNESDVLPKILPEIRIATPWYKPERNKTELSPDYHLRTTEAWLVFPHELCGIDKSELLAHKPGIDGIKQHLS